jgi:hypothetical protein
MEVADSAIHPIMELSEAAVIFLLAGVDDAGRVRVDGSTGTVEATSSRHR